MATFMGIRPGDTVVYRARAGQDYLIKKGKACGLLLFPRHVVLNTGGPHGTPQVVDENNYVSHRRS